MTDRTWQKRTIESVELFQQAKFREAEQGFVESVRLARDSQAGSADLGEVLNNLSIVYFALSKFSDCQSVLKEALSLTCDNPEEQALLRVCTLNNRARLLAELEQLAEAEADLLEAAELAKPIHPSYAAEICGNLSRVYASVPRWRDKAREMSDEFERLHRIDESLDIYYDDLAAWRRPGRSWDHAWSTSKESVDARILANRAACMYESQSEAVAEYEAIVELDKQTKAVAPHLVAYAQLMLAEASFQTDDYQSATKFAEAALSTADSSYLKMHPANFHTIIRTATYSVLSNNPDKSRSLFQRTEELLRTTLGEWNPYMAQCISAQALMLVFCTPAGADQTKEREAIFRKSLDILRDFYPDNHSKLIALNVFLSDICMRTHRLDEAEKILLECADNAKTSFQSNELECRCLMALADLRLKQERVSDAMELAHRHEKLLDEQTPGAWESKLRSWILIGQQYTAAREFDSAEKLYKKAMEKIPSRHHNLIHKIKILLASSLMQSGKTNEANALLSKPEDKSGGASEQVNKRNELADQSRLAWAMQTSQRLDEAKSIATTVVNQASLLMPECEESLLMAVSVLIEQAKGENKPDEIQRLIGILAEYKSSIRLRSVMPTLYLEAAQSFAKQRSIKADALFDQAIQAAEAIEAIQQKSLDNCCAVYLNHCMSTKQQEKASQLCERLLKLRAAGDGTTSGEYANALTSKTVLLLESDPNGAEATSLQALEILDGLAHCNEHQLILTLIVRAQVLKKLLRFEQGAELEKRAQVLTNKLKDALKEAKG